MAAFFFCDRVGSMLQTGETTRAVVKTRAPCIRSFRAIRGYQLDQPQNPRKTREYTETFVINLANIFTASRSNTRTIGRLASEKTALVQTACFLCYSVRLKPYTRR